MILILHYSLTKLLSLSNALSDCVVKFTTYYLHYKDKLVGYLIWHFGCTTNYLCFLFNQSNFLAVFLFIYNGNVYTTKPGFITKEGKLLKTFLYLLFYIFQLLSLFFNSMLSNKIDKTGKYIIKKHKTDKYGVLNNFRKSCQYCNIVSQLLLGIVILRFYNYVNKQDCAYL